MDPEKEREARDAAWVEHQMDTWAPEFEDFVAGWDAALAYSRQHGARAADQAAFDRRILSTLEQD